MMRVYRGVSREDDADRAVADATREMGDVAPGIVFAFPGGKQDPAQVAVALQERFPRTLIVGASTPAPLSDGKRCAGALAVAAVHAPSTRWSARSLDLSRFDAEAAGRAVDAMLGELELDRDSVALSQVFCLLFVDGLAKKEESVAAILAEALDGIALVGGSAGDDLSFASTFVIHGRQALQGAATIVLARCSEGFTVFKHQHFTTSARRLAVTRAEVSARRVREMDGVPALEAYAAALGIPAAEVTPAIASQNPLIFRCGDALYVRSVQQIEADGSMIFYCAIEPGMVLSIGIRAPQVPALQAALADLPPPGTIGLFLVFNCILRSLEALEQKHEDVLASMFSEASCATVGFDTFGEQWNGLHINQTVVGVAIHHSTRDGGEG
jgi:hypothetical protein